MATQLNRFSPSVEVYLRGKEARNSVPGLSDLDYWIFLAESELQTPQTLLKLRIIFRKLRKSFILPVKLEVTSRLGWNLSQSISPASYLQDMPLIKFTSTGWLKLETTSQQSTRPLSRLNLCFYEYKSAQSCLSKATENMRFQHAIFCKHIKKLTEFADIDLPIVHGNILQLQAHALITLDRLAVIASREVNNIPEVQIIESSKKADWVNSHLHASVKQFAEFMVEYDQVSDMLIWKIEQPDLKSSEKILSIFEKIPKDKRPQFLVTETVWKCLWRGPAFGPLLENLDLIHNEFFKNQESVASDIYQMLRDRTVTRINHNLGVLVSYDQNEFIAPLLYQCFEILIIHCRQITNDLNLLCSMTENDCPLTAKWLKRLESKKIPSTLKEWSEAFIEVRSEALKVIARTTIL